MSQRNSGYARKAHDLYATPDWCTVALLASIVDYLPNEPVIWEPAAGPKRMISDMLTDCEAGEVIATDIQDNPPIDFFTTPTPDGCNVIITNPPYTRAVCERFVRRAVGAMQLVDGLVAMLLKVDWDSASTRRDLFGECPAWGKKLILTRRIVWFQRYDGEREAPSENHAWFIWDWKRDANARATIDYYYE